jgi:predicted esterase
MPLPFRVCFLLAPGLSLLAVAVSAAPAAPATGFQPEVQVESATRLDWEFAVADFGRDAARLPSGYDSRKQRYQLFVPKSYDAGKLWPLVVFVSPGDDPLGWRFWQKPCEEAGALFCAAYAAGNNCPVGQRTRIVLDVLDDVRRRYRIDPDQTYLTGFSGGGRMACSIAFALPEYFGGVIPVCGTNPLNRQDYLRHRVQDRLSVAFVTGAADFNRKENEEYMHPFFQDLGIRSRLWVVPKLGHGVPGPEVLTEVLKWLADDLPRRRAEAKARPGLAPSPDDVPTPLRQAARALEAAEAELKVPDRTWRAVALLRGIVSRWGHTDSADKARKLLEEVQADPKWATLLAEQGGKEERSSLAAQARALDRFGDARRALQAWQTLARNHPDSDEGKKAAAEVQRLKNVLAATPYLGVAFTSGLTVGQVAADGPADRAGIKAGDRLLRLGDVKLASLQDLRKALQSHKPGDKIVFEVERAGKPMTVTVEVAATPAPGDE